MADELEHKSLEVVEFEGTRYVRINPNDVNLGQMTPVQRVADVVAAQVSKGAVKVITKHGKEIETINYAGEGDWIVYDIGASDFKKMIMRILNCERKAITKDNFSQLYRSLEGDLGLTPEDTIKIIHELVMDNTDNQQFAGASFINKLKQYKYVGKQVFAAVVPYNFVILAPWNKDQFIKKGGLIIYDPNIKNAERKEIYGIDGTRERVPGVFEKTFTVAGGDNKVIADTFKEAIKADRSPIAGIQYDNIDLAKAYQRAGTKMPKFLQKFINN